MSKNRKLLKSAAKAMHLAIVGWNGDTPLIASDGCRSGYPWNPLQNKEDCFDLECILGVDIKWEHALSGVEASLWNSTSGTHVTHFEPYGDDRDLARMRAVVRVVAGKELSC